MPFAMQDKHHLVSVGRETVKLRQHFLAIFVRIVAISCQRYTVMSEAAISTLKNQLPEWVHKAEQGEDIQITRHGKPVAVMVSLERYNRAFGMSKGVFNAYLRWRAKYPDGCGFTDAEQDALYQRTRTPHEPRSVWD